MYRKKINGKWVVISEKKVQKQSEVVIYGMSRTDLAERKQSLMRYFNKSIIVDNEFDTSHFYKKYLKSKKWDCLRKEILLKKNKCSINGCCNMDLHLHHIRYNNLGTPLEHKDIVVLCSDHHKQVHVRAGLKRNRGKLLSKVTNSMIDELNTKHYLKYVFPKEKNAILRKERRKKELLDIFNS